MTEPLHRQIFSEAEWALVLELLERERHELPIEIHHTSTRKYRELLRERLRLVETVLERIESAAA